MVPRLLVPAVSCPKCSYPNDNSFKFCQRCGYKRQLQASMTTTSLKAPINWIAIKERKDSLEKRLLSTPYARQKSSLEKVLSVFLGIPIAKGHGYGDPRWHN